jgi:hypothetical protein
MTPDEFIESVKGKVPPSNLGNPLEALWHEAKGNWEKAHAIAQDDSSPQAAWVHAYLHRKEGDLGNASYWYTRAGRKPPRSTFEEEWQVIVKELLRMESSNPNQKLKGNP